MRHIFMQRPGNGRLKLFMLVFVCNFLITGCGSVRGDWEINLTKNYYITRTNSRSIYLTHKESETDIGSSFVIERNYFVQAFCYNDRFIGLKGIHTELTAATDVEIESNDTSYYLIDTSDSKVYGPYFSAEKFEYKCIEYDISPLGEWYYTADINYESAKEWKTD